MKRRRGFTLAELIAAIALLAVFSIFTVQMFAKADQLSRKARNLDQAVACASNLADFWRSELTENVPPEIIELRNSRSADAMAVISLDAYFEVCDPAAAQYQAVLSLQHLQAEDGEDPQAGIWQLNIVIGRIKPSDSAPVYSLKISRYFPEEVK